MKIVMLKRLLILAVAIEALIAGGCKPAAGPLPAVAEPPVEVTTVQPHRGEIYRYINLPGEVRPLFQVTLFAKVDGYLDVIAVDKGDSVKAGDLIADIDVPELRANHAKYKAEVELAEAEFKQIYESSTNHPTNVSPGELQDAQNRIAVGKGKLDLAKANLEYTESMLNYARVTAPFEGIITKRYVDPGAYIPVPNAADTPAAAAIVDLTDFKTLRMQVAVPETEVPHIQLGQPVRWTTDDYPGQSFDGNVTRAYWALEGATRTMLTEVQMTNRGMMLRPGMLVNAKIALEKRQDTLLLPEGALVKEKAGSFVFIDDAGKARKVPVQTGFEDGTNVEILAGIWATNLAIVAGQQPLRDGLQVKIAGSNTLSSTR
jgi:RND family efflux transporter MFP subunit